MIDALTPDTRAARGSNGVDSPASAALYRQACQYIPGGTSRLHNYFQPHPLYMRAGRGCRVEDVDGVERLDFLNNMTALIHGHGHPAISRAITSQLERGVAFSEPSEPEVDLARVITERVATVEQIRFANSGTEAVMTAVKLARAFTGRSRIAKFEGFYHGYYDYVQISFSSTAATWGPADAPASVPNSGGLSRRIDEEVVVLPFNDRAAVERLFEQHGATLAALIIDPLSQRAGFPLPGPGFYAFLRDLTRAYGVLLIFDEVISFRVDYRGAQARYGGEPDLTTFGKIVGGGLPVGAVGGRADVMAMLDPSHGAPPVVSGGTFSGNPLTMAAGRAALEHLTAAEIERLNALGERLRTRATAVFATANEPGQVAGDGSLFRIVLRPGPIGDYRDLLAGSAPAERMSRLHLNLLEEGVVVAVNGLGCVSTPMGDAEVDRFVDALGRAIDRLPRPASGSAHR